MSHSHDPIWRALYKAALTADEAFRTELERVYGDDGDARYRYQHDDPEVSAAGAAKLAADAKLSAHEQRNELQSFGDVIGSSQHFGQCPRCGRQHMSTHDRVYVHGHQVFCRHCPPQRRQSE